MTENWAFLGVRPRTDPHRSVSTSHGGVSTTFQSCQSVAVGALFAVIRRMSAKGKGPHVSPRQRVAGVNLMNCAVTN